MIITSSTSLISIFPSSNVKCEIQQFIIALPINLFTITNSLFRLARVQNPNDCISEANQNKQALEKQVTYVNIITKATSNDYSNIVIKEEA